MEFAAFQPGKIELKVTKHTNTVEKTLTPSLKIF